MYSIYSYIMKTLILVTGYKRTGKDSFANIFSTEKESVGIYQIARKIKENSANALGISYDEFNEHKDNWRFYVVDEHGNDKVDYPIRRIAEHVGNDMMLSFGFSKHAIALSAMEEVFKKEEEYKIITDVRLLSEVESFNMANHGYRVVVLRIVRDGFIDPVPSKHRTNIECKLIIPDYTITASDLVELKTNTLKFITWLNS